MQQIYIYTQGTHRAKHSYKHTHRAALAIRQRLRGIHQAQVLLQVALSELGHQLAVVEALERGGVQASDGAREEAAAQRRVGHDFDAYQ